MGQAFQGSDNKGTQTQLPQLGMRGPRASTSEYSCYASGCFPKDCKRRSGPNASSRGRIRGKETLVFYRAVGLRGAYVVKVPFCGGLQTKLVRDYYGFG